MNSKSIILKVVFTFLLSFCIYIVISAQNNAKYGLKDALKDKWLIGVAINSNQILEKDPIENELIKRNFNSVVAENCMKSEVIHPLEGQFNYTLADQFVKYGLKNNMFIIGHTLIWHSQSPKWFFIDNKGNTVSRTVLIKRMKTHITTIMNHFKGKVNGWDVVNEAFDDDGTYRESPFYKIIGKDYIKLAFQFAHKADPKAQLYYNDYSLEHPKKRDAVIAMVKELQKQGIPIYAIGSQSHMTMSFPKMNELENSIVAFSKLGVKVMITELDITILPNPDTNSGADISTNFKYDKKLNPYPDSLPANIANDLNNRYNEVFKVFMKHHNKISRVTLWGLTDKDSWRNDWPVKGRTDYPLLFDRKYNPKPTIGAIIYDAKNNK